jgi:hypothetical protein
MQEMGSASIPPLTACYLKSWQMMQGNIKNQKQKKHKPRAGFEWWINTLKRLKASREPAGN